MADRPPFGMNLVTQKMGIAEWSYSNDYNPAKRQKMKHVDLRERFKQLSLEVELGFDLEQTAREVERCLNCDIQTVFTDKKCIECDACIDVCPTACLTITQNGEEPDLRKRLTVPATNLTQELFLSGAAAADRAGDGEGRGRLRALRPLCRTVPHRRLGHVQARIGGAQSGDAGDVVGPHRSARQGTGRAPQLSARA